ncbi:MAG: plasmid partitioning protein RepB [Mesorhizobium sp.]|nr:MAG: plasmid partitioning protein RepB [Mesorhizobium sp.]
MIEIDPALVDSTFVCDRIGIDVLKLAQLREQIKDHGQQVPILVRPHPDARGRYQVAYGHRRLAAVKVLGINVRAVVRELSDDQLVVSQGQENNARTNLSYIERASFAVRLEDRSFSRETIMAALGIDKAALSKMVSGPAAAGVIGIVHRHPVAIDEVGRKDDQVGTAGVTQRWKQDTAQPCCDNQIGEFPRRWNFLVDASDLAPGTIPLVPGAIPDVRVKPLRKVGYLGERDLISGKGGRRSDAGALLVFLERRLG